jgi:hypothetical protein
MDSALCRRPAICEYAGVQSHGRASPQSGRCQCDYRNACKDDERRAQAQVKMPIVIGVPHEPLRVYHFC